MKKGNYKLNGKKEKMLSCKYCVVYNHKSTYFKHLADKEIRTYSKDLIDKYSHSHLSPL